jgi:hypothetical protein
LPDLFRQLIVPTDGGLYLHFRWGELASGQARG